MDPAGKKLDAVVVSNVDGEPVDVDQAEPAADVSRGLAIGLLIREVMVEMVATFVVIFWSCVAVVMQETYQTLTLPLTCLVVAMTVAFVLSWVGPAHFNPAVTITFAAYRRFPAWPNLPLYIAAQLSGSLLACLAVNAIMDPPNGVFYGTAPMVGGRRLPFVMEMTASAVLMVVIAGVATDVTVGKTAGGIAIGAAVGGLGLVIGPVSGGSMNPVRSLGPAIVLGRYDGVWIYMVAPVVGMIIGAFCSRIVRRSHRIVAFLCGGGGGGGSTPAGVAGAHAVAAVAV
uniref:Aquaporin n=1 Tax=Leersia perrieri TaxID=77586 RepID=A0A0D9UVZ5_9ORYZ